MAFLESMKFIEVIRDDADLLSATPEDVLNSKGFVGKNKKIQFGTIPVNAQQSNQILNAGIQFTVPFGYNPREYTISAASLIGQTQGTAINANILINKTAWVNGVLVTGTMPDNAAQTATLDAGDQVNINLGYHNGSGIIKAKGLAEQTYGTAKASDILSGMIAWVNGIQIAGMMPNNPNQNISLAGGESYTIPAGYHSGSSVVSAKTVESQTAATAVASDIAYGKTAWVNGVLITGNVPRITATTVTLPLNGSYSIPAGIHSGLGIVTQNIDTLPAITITPGFQPQTIAVKDKYMTEDITVTGIDALNFKNYTTSNGLLYDNNTSVTLSTSGDTLIYSAPDDNWHDQATSNVYAITVTIEGKVVAGVIFSNNLNNNAVDTKTVYVSDIITITHNLNPTTNVHRFYISCSGTGTGTSSINVKIREVMSLRRYGDDHDVD